MLDNLTAAREQMALSLSFHIVFAVFGVALPWLLLYAESRARKGDEDWERLARTWSTALAVLFGVGAVSGTVLSVEFGLLWPSFMEKYGAAFGISFAMEAFAFFLEAIFLGLYLYGRGRLSARARMWCLVPVAVSGLASAAFVTTANAWMNTPVGLIDTGGRIVAADPLAPFHAPTALPQVVHLLLAAFLVTGFGVAAVYAVGLLRGRRDGYHRRGFGLGLAVALIAAPVQVLVGDWATRAVAEYQPAKFAAIEGVAVSGPHAPFTIGGVWTGDRMVGAVEIPDGLSLLLRFSPAGAVRGLDSVPLADRAPVTVAHLAFDLMIGVGSAFLLFGVVALWLRRRGALAENRWVLRATVVAAPAAVAALLSGWVATEVGRQPWIVYGLMRTADAVSTQPRLYVFYWVSVLVYGVLAVALVGVLRRLARRTSSVEVSA